MYGVSDGLAKEWKEKEKDEEAKKAKSDIENTEREKEQEGRGESKEVGGKAGKGIEGDKRKEEGE